MKVTLGIVAGFIIWSVLWLAGSQLGAVISPGWYGQNMADFHEAVARRQPFTVQTSMMLIVLLTSFICSFISGLAAVAISKEFPRTTLFLGILLLLAGLPVEIAYWSYFPVWYHLTFLILLIPMTIAGGKIKESR